MLAGSWPPARQRAMERRRPRIVLGRNALALLSALALSLPVAADEVAFRGTTIERQDGDYLVLKDANIRAKPGTGSKRLGKLEAMTRIRVVGRPPGTAWLAIRADGKDVGFVYAPLTVPLIDGRLETALTGTAVIPDGPTCEYVVRYRGKGEMFGAPFDAFDYDVRWRCADDGGSFAFYSFMFITEGPFAISRTPLYQISVEVPRIAGDYDDLLSTIVLFRKDKGRLAFDRVTLKKYRAPSPKKSAAAETVTDALLGALEIAATSWNHRVWEALRGRGE